MVFERIIEDKDHLWAVRDMNKPKNELALCSIHGTTSAISWISSWKTLTT